MNDRIDRKIETFASTLLMEMRGLPQYSVHEAVKRWQRFAQDCIDGFPWDLDDYNNDLLLRSNLQLIIESLNELGDPKDAAPFLAKVKSADSLSREVLTVQSFTANEWWYKYTPRYAANHFCEEFASAYGVRLSPCSLYDDCVVEFQQLITESKDLTSALISARHNIRYFSANPALLFRSCRASTSLKRGERKTIWAWVNDSIGDNELRARMEGLA